MGLPLAVEFGKNRRVVGFDINAERIETLRAGYDTTLEVSHNELRESVGLQLSSSTTDLEDSNVYIVTVPTPIDEHKRPNLEPLLKASQMLGHVPSPAIL